MYGATFDVLFDQESIKLFTRQKDLKGRKARRAKILREFDLNLRYRQGRYNVVADALSRMPEVEALFLMEIKSSLLDSLCGQYEHDPIYKEVWKLVLSRDSSPQDSAQVVADDATATQASTATSDAMQ